jgi:hypothetical protein
MTWTDDFAEVVVFGHVLVTTNELDDARSVLDYFEKPHKWQPEYELWIEAGRPREASDAGWAQFTHNLQWLGGLIEERVSKPRTPPPDPELRSDWGSR